MKSHRDCSWIGQAFAEAIRRYRECEWLRLPHCYDYGDVCIFCGKQNPKTHPLRLRKPGRPRKAGVKNDSNTNEGLANG